MIILIVFFMSATGAVSSTTAEFNSVDACESARSTVLAYVPTPNKVAVCVAK